MSKKLTDEEKVQKIIKNKNINVKEVINCYRDLEYSLPKLKKQFNLGFKESVLILKQNNIKIRSISESRKTNTFKKENKENLLEKYGVSNVSSLDSVKEKKRKTSLKNYGVDNIWKTKDYGIKAQASKEKKYGTKAIPNLYGKANYFGWKSSTEEEKKKRLQNLWSESILSWNSLTEEQKTKIIQKRSRKIVSCYNSSLERKIKNSLQKLNILYSEQFWINRKSYDFHIKIFNVNYVLEINGDYWHANPLYYKENDFINYPLGLIKVKEIWDKDLIKKQNAEKYGYKTLYIWESELKNKSEIEIENLIKEKLKLNKISYSAQNEKCENFKHKKIKFISKKT